MIPWVRHHEAEHPDLPGEELRWPGDLGLDVEDGVSGLHGQVGVQEGVLWQAVILRKNHREYC